jgi:DNA-3-methyladenine glycosylase
MRERRGSKPDHELCSGPGKLTEALGITLSDNECDLNEEPFLLVAPEGERPEIVTGPRIGITKAVENPWRFCAAGNRNVSRPRPPSRR